MGKEVKYIIAIVIITVSQWRPKQGEASEVGYTQSPIIKNGPIRNDAEILGKFKERTLSRSKSRNA